MTTTSPARVRSRIGPLSVLWALLAALLTALAFPTPAYASNFVVQLNPGSVDVTTGQGGQTVEVTLQNTVPKADGVSATVALEGLDNQADISVDAGNCSGVNGNTVDCGAVDAADKRTFSVTVNPSDSAGLAEGDTSSGTLTVTMDGSNQGSESAAVNVIGGQTPGITGTVTNVDDSEPLEGATVEAEYSDGSGDKTTSAEDGTYTLENPVEGKATITITADGFDEYTEEVAISGGKEVSLSVGMTPKDENADRETQEANVAGKEEDDEAGVGWTSIVLMILGFLLIVGAIVAIVLLIRKGRAEKNEDEAPELPSTPPIHNPSATQTGQLGVYDSAARPGMDAPTMIHNGPLVRDGERPSPSSAPVSGGYASNEPVSAGFGPAYGSQSGSTRRYPSAEGGDGWGNNYRDAAVGGYANEPVSGSYGRGNEPVSGSYGYGQHQEPASGGYRSNEPVSGYGRGNEPVSGSYSYGQHQEPASGGYRSNEPVSGYGRGNEPVSGSYSYGQHQEPASGGYRDPASYRSADQGGGYSGGYPSDQGYPEDYAPRQSRPRRYRDDADDRPQSW